MCHKLAAALDGSKAVVYAEDQGLVFSWNGYHTVNIYDLQGRPIDMMSIGDFALRSATSDEVSDAIAEYLKPEGEEEDED